jgi:hypothetical protein
MHRADGEEEPVHAIPTRESRLNNELPFYLLAITNSDQFRSRIVTR